MPKSNWANQLDAPPFEAYAITCGITFTFGGLRINGDSQVLDTDEQPIPGLYAAGELVGGLFYFNYAGGTGLRSEEHTSELQSLMRNSYAVFCLKKKITLNKDMSFA